MKALKLSTTAKDKQRLDAKCKELLTRAEKIKESKEWHPATHGVPRKTSPSRTLVSTRKLTTREEIILLEGAKLNGFIFPPWVTSPDLGEFEREEGESPYLYAQ